MARRNALTEGEIRTKPYNAKLIPFAKYLRKNMTQEERKLWYQFLRTYPIRSQRQKTICNYICDFYCAKARLIIEVDGPNHDLPEHQYHDQQRTAILNKHGLTILRYTNQEIDLHFGRVCQSIDYAIKKRLLNR